MTFRYFSGSRVPLLSGEELFFSPVSGKTCALPRQASAAAAQCTRFATLDEHAARLSSAVKQPSWSSDVWRSHLRQAVDLGVLLSYRDVRDAVAHGIAPADSGATIDKIGVATRNRPAMLARLLASIDGQARRFNRSVDVLVVDDSDDPAAQLENERIGEQFAAEASVHVQYANHDSRKRYVERLSAESGVPRDLVRFALLNPGNYSLSVGACRNTILLGSAGHGLLFLDDDVLCRTARIPESRDNIAFSNDTFHSWFFKDLGGIEACDFTGEDVVGLHERALNIDRESEGLEVGAISSECIRRVQAGNASVVVSLTGIAGDAATNDPLAYFFQGRRTVARLTSDPELFGTALNNRVVLCGPTRTIVAEYLPCMSYCMALDNRRLLPPFMPVERGEEFVFGSLVSRCVPGALFAATPRAILHLPQDERRFSPDAALARAGKLTAAETLAALIGAQLVGGAQTEDRLKAMSLRVAEAGGMDEQRMPEQIRNTVAPAVVAQLRAVDVAMDECQRRAPFCVEDLRALKNEYIAALNDWDYSAPFDLASTYGPQEGRRRFRTLLTTFARLLDAWPDLVAAARALEARGVTPFAEASNTNDCCVSAALHRRGA